MGGIGQYSVQSPLDMTPNIRSPHMSSVLNVAFRRTERYEFTNDAVLRTDIINPQYWPLGLCLTVVFMVKINNQTTPRR
ncbi:hypothetical protein FRC20_011022 [Serendipita sp. 405]|nr:hypothetical protein FRC20_011022 [Serendipita sp. 405]